MPAANTCWGIEVGAGAVKALKLEVVDDRPRVVDFAYIPHAKVLSTPELDQEDAKRVALGRLVTEFDLSNATIAVSVPGHSAFARFAKLPPVDPKKVPDIVKFEAVQQIPFPLEQVEWDYQTFVSPDSPDVEVGIFAITKERINGELMLLRDMRIVPDLVTLSPVAVYNAMAFDLQFTEKTQGTILLDVGTTSTDLIIADAGRVWIRTFPIGGHEFTKALVEQFKLSYPKAEKLKREAEQSKHARHVFQAMRPVFTDLVQDVQRSVGYYQSLHREADLSRLIGLGSTFKLPGLRKYLKQQLGINVYRIDAFKGLTAEGPRAAEFEALSLNMCTAYGLALQGLGMGTLQANLMPVKVSREAMWERKKRWFLAAAGLSLAATGSMFIRPLMDKNAAAATPAPASINRAVTMSRTLVSEANAAGVTSVGQGAFDAANMISVFDRREVIPLLLDDVSRMVEEANRAGETGAAPVHLRRLSTEYLHAESSTPPRSAGSRDSYSDRDSSGDGHQGRMSVGRDDRQPSGWDETPQQRDPGTGRPRVRVTLELTTPRSAAEARIHATETVMRWLQQNAKREGVAYVLELVGDGSLQVAQAAALSSTAGPAASAGARAPRGREIPSEVREEGRGGRQFNQPVRDNVVGGPEVPRQAQEAFQAEVGLARFAPIVAPEKRVPEGSVESVVTVTFEAVLVSTGTSGEGSR
ncbi:MAG: type IV pilus assembly protein PilM [Phycisphaeraceae bacterium]|nr:type IV pilus assembly protein PilM [Phycisphaeraceae bacterium]